MATQVYTSVAANYIPKARVLARSVKQFHPDFQFHLVLCDAVPAWFSLSEEPFDSLITLNDLGLQNPKQWIFQHTLVELSTGVKGFALEKLLALPNSAEVLYLDPDIVVLSPLDRLISEFAHASILLTPHLVEPEITREAILDNEFSVLQHGVYNLGFIGVKNSPEGRRFAAWWADRLNHFCFDDIPRGVFTDQRWADLVPAYFSDHRVLRDAVYNVCTWNLTHRQVTGSAPSALLVNGEPIVFYHFSGFDSGAQQGMLDKYGKDMPALYELREWYIAECDRMGQHELSALRWAYGFFENGERILNAHRKLYRERPDLQAAFPDPYSTSGEDGSFWNWFNAHGNGSGAALQTVADSNESLSAPEYRIFVLAAAGDGSFSQETVDRVWQHSHRREEIFFAGFPGALYGLTLPPQMEWLPIEGERFEDLFDAVLQRFPDKDALLIRAGGLPPEKWDLRLSWSAVRQLGVATVSPTDERLLDKSGTLRSHGASDRDLLDRLCYLSNDEPETEISSFSRDCVYVRSAALREVSEVEGYSDAADLLEKAAKLRYSHLRANHICVSWRRPRTAEVDSGDTAGLSSFARLRDRVRSRVQADSVPPPRVIKAMAGPNLHIMHSWGGGLERWVADYSRADLEHENLVLKSVGPHGYFGSKLHLYRNIDDREPLQEWSIDPPIKASVTSHAGYQQALTQVLREHQVQRIVVSSVIGHSLDALGQPIPTIFVCHDYYPFCPALNITFDGVCHSCEEPRLAACIQENVHNRFFPNVPPAEWLSIRSAFVRSVKNHRVTLIAPSGSVRENYARLCPELAPFFQVIPHGTPALESGSLDLEFDAGSRLRVVVLGSLAPHKGGFLLECILPELLGFCDVTLLGCGDYGRQYSENPNVELVPEYQRDALPELLKSLKPDVGILLSVVPETFSYTLRELQELGVPVLATNIGSFPDRIQEGVTGFLCAPEPAVIVQRLRSLAEDRGPLRRVHQNLTNLPHRSIEDMLRDYEQLYPTRYLAERYFAPKEFVQPLPERSLQLFWRMAGHSFEEKFSVTVAPLGAESQIVRLFFAPSREPIEELRLDLSAQPGFFLLYGLTLRDHNQAPIWSWNRDLSSLKSAVHNDVVFFDSNPGEPYATLYFPSSDPSVILPIEPVLLAGINRGGCLEVECRPASADDSVSLAISSAAGIGEAAQSRTQVEELVSQMAALISESQHRDERIHALENDIAGVEQSFSWRITRPVRAFAATARKILRVSSQSSSQTSSRGASSRV